MIENETVVIDGVAVRTDPAARGGIEALMFMMWEEQPSLWAWVKPFLQKIGRSVTGSIDFLDVGTGSGVFSLLFARHFGGRVLALDKNSRAIRVAQNNARENGVSGNIEFREEHYSPTSVDYRSCKVIGVYPPYHLYPAELELQTPLHARGGSLGQREFISQLALVDLHLAEGGLCFFNMMCLGDADGPQYLKYASQIVAGSSLRWMNIFPPTSTAAFLRRLYGELFLDWQERVSKRHPLLYLTDGLIHRDGAETTQEVAHELALNGKTWDDRIDVHRAINIRAGLNL